MTPKFLLNSLDKLNPNWLIKFLFWGVMVVLLADLLLLVVNPEDIRGVESNPVYTVQQLLENNQWLYQDPEVAPYNITQYSPIYYVIADQFVSLFGVESTSPYTVRILMRLLSIILSIITALLFYRIVFLISKNKGWAFILSLLFIVFCYPWNFIGRPDVMVTLCYVVVVYLIQRIGDETKPMLAIAIGAVCAVAVLSKLNGLLLLPISILYFLFRKQRVRVIYLGIGFTVSVPIILGLFTLLNYDLTFLGKNMFDGVDNGIDLKAAIGKPYENFVNYFMVFLIGSSFALIPILKKGLANEFDSLELFVPIAFLASLLFAILTALKIGSAINYFNDAMILLLVIWAIYLGQQSSEGKKLALSFLMIVGVQIGSNHLFRYVPLHIDQIRMDYLRNNDGLNQTVRFIEQNLGEAYFFSDQREISMRIPHKSILFQMDIRSTTFGRDVYSHSHLANSIEDGTIKYLVLQGSMYPILGVRPYSHYSLIRTFGEYKVYEHTP